MTSFLELCPRLKEILGEPHDEKHPFDNLYAGIELLRPLAEEAPMSSSGYCASVQAARMCYDCLEFSSLKKFVADALEFEQGIGYTEKEQVSLEEFCMTYPHLSPMALKLRATEALHYSSQEQFEEALSPLLECEKAALSVLELEDDIADVFFEDVEFEKADEGTVAKRELLDILIHCLFYGAEICENLDLTNESAAFCRKCLMLQLEHKMFTPIEWIKQATDLQRYYAIHCEWEEAYDFLNETAAMAVEFLAGTTTGSENLIEKTEEEDALQLWIHLREKGDEIIDLLEAPKETILEYFFGVVETLEELLSHCYAAGFRCCGQGIYNVKVLFQSANDPHKLDKLNSGLVTQLFNESLSMLKLAERYFVLDGFVTMHTNIRLAWSHLLELRAKFFENSIKVQEERIGLIRPLILKISSHHFPRIYEELLVELNDARYEIFTHIYETQPQNEQLVASCAAGSIEQYQTYVKYLESAAFVRAKTELNKSEPQFDDWIVFIHDDSIESYIDACFNESTIFSKFPFQKKQMMQNALNGFTFCEKLWKAFKSRVDGDFEENLRLVAEMRTLMQLRLSEME